MIGGKARQETVSGPKGMGEKTSGVQYATDVKTLLFLARLEFLCKKTGCVPHYFQYKEAAFLFFPQNLSSQILNYQILNMSRTVEQADNDKTGNGKVKEKKRSSNDGGRTIDKRERVDSET